MSYIFSSLDVPTIVKSIHLWVQMLSSRNYIQASDFLYDASKMGGLCWSAETITDALGLYSRQYREAPIESKINYVPIVTVPILSMLKDENRVIFTKTSRGLLYIDYDLPINNAWSDLTASFIVHAVPTGFCLELVDIHAL